MGPIESFLALVDQLSALVRARQQSRRDLFSNIVEPLFVELQPLVDDYFKLFRGTRNLVESSTAPQLSRAVAELKEKREAMLHLRRKVVAMAEAVAAEVKDKKTVDFASRVANFFFCSQLEGPRKMSESKRIYVELLDLVNDEGADKDQFLQGLTRTLQQLEESWVAIAQAYAVLRLRALQS